MRLSINHNRMLTSDKAKKLIKLFTRFQANGKIPYCKTNRLYRKVKVAMSNIRMAHSAPQLTSNRLS